jgi:hypothetical protein
MTEDLTRTADPTPWAMQTWWAARRRRYNIGLLVAGPLGFICYAAAVSRCIDLRVPGDWEITIFTTLFQGFAYLVMIGIANLCYYVGPWSEQLFRPANVARYRKTAFQLGFWFSVLLPFTPFALLMFYCSLHAGEDKRIILELARPGVVVAAFLFRQYW